MHCPHQPVFYHEQSVSFALFSVWHLEVLLRLGSFYRLKLLHTLSVKEESQSVFKLHNHAIALFININFNFSHINFKHLLASRARNLIIQL